ncbi:MAG: ABC transporter substrate-binding protein [Candidatus Acidiferrales bacterium]
MSPSQNTVLPRIVSLAPNVTSILVAIGARRALVGVSRWCADVAPMVAGLPRVGDCWKMDVAEVMKLRPDLVIGSVPFRAEVVVKIIEQPVAFLAISPRSLAGIRSDIRLLGRLASRGEAAEKLIRQMQRAFEAVARRASRMAAEKPRVYAEAWPHPRISSPPWVAELIEIAGGIPATVAGQKVSDAEVAQLQPDAIVLAWTATGDRAKTSRAYGVKAWKDVPAIRDRRVFVVRDDLLNTPGPPLMDGVRALFDVIHQPGRARRWPAFPSSTLDVHWK